MSREMKDSGVEWLGEIPSDWNITNLKKVSKIKTGSTPSGKSEEKFSDISGLEWIKTNNLLGTDGISESKLKITSEYEKKATLAPLYSTLVCCIGDIGKLGFNTELVSYNQQINAVNFNNDLVNWKYGFYSLYAQKDQHIAHSNGNVLRILNTENQKKITISIPSMKEQIIIVKVLDKKTSEIDTIVEKTRKSIEELKAYKQSLITETVTKGLNSDVLTKDSGIESIGYIADNWQLIKLKYLYKSNKGLTITKANLQDEGIPVVSYGDIHSRYGFKFNPEINPVKFVDKTYLEKNPLAKLNRGNFIFADTSEDLEGSGNFTVFDSDLLTLAGYHTIVLKPRTKINYKFIAYLFDSQAYRQQIQKMMQGVKVNSISQNILKNTMVWLPSEEEQKEIVNFLNDRTNKLDELITKKQQMLKELESYKQSLIYEYVTGKKEVK